MSCILSGTKGDSIKERQGTSCINLSIDDEAPRVPVSWQLEQTRHRAAGFMDRNAQPV